MAPFLETIDHKLVRREDLRRQAQNVRQADLIMKEDVSKTLELIEDRLSAQDDPVAKIGVRVLGGLAAMAALYWLVSGFVRRARRKKDQKRLEKVEVVGLRPVFPIHARDWNPEQVPRGLDSRIFVQLLNKDCLSIGSVFSRLNKLNPHDNLMCQTLSNRTVNRNELNTPRKSGDLFSE